MASLLEPVSRPEVQTRVNPKSLTLFMQRDGRGIPYSWCSHAPGRCTCVSVMCVGDAVFCTSQHVVTFQDRFGFWGDIQVLCCCDALHLSRAGVVH